MRRLKQFIVVIGLSIIIMINTMTLISVESTTNRRRDLNRAVAAAVKQTVKATMTVGQGEIKSEKEMIGQFVNILSTEMKSEGDISIKVIGVNYKEGLLDVCVTQKYQYLNGREGKVSVRKCAICE